MAYQPKNWRWCKHCQRDTSKNGHAPFCPATTIEAAHGIHAATQLKENA